MAWTQSLTSLRISLPSSYRIPINYFDIMLESLPMCQKFEILVRVEDYNFVF